MRRFGILWLTFSVFLFSAQTVTAAEKDKKQIELKTIKEKMSYVVGTQIGAGIKRQKLDPDYDVLIQAIKDTVNNEPARFTPEEIQQIMREYQKEEIKKRAIKLLGDKVWKIQLKKPEMMEFDKNKEYFWILETNKGTIKFKFMPGVAPMHVTSTIFLTKKGFYDGLTFHRVEPGFVIQGGDPLGTGEGGPGYTYEGEYNAFVKHSNPYLLSMANAGPGTDGSQFFITLTATPHLDFKHTIFGKVVDGKAVIKEMEKAGTRGGKPKEPLIIIKATIEEKAKK